MKRNLKAIALALAAVFAISAIAASSALAVGEEFHSEEKETVIEATSHPETTQDFELENGLKVECPVLHAEGTVTGTKTEEKVYTADEITVGIDYTGSGENNHCDGAEKTTNVKVEDENCHYRFDSDTTVENPTPGEHANVALTCDSGGIKLTDTETGLKLTVPNQEIPHAVHYDNTGSGAERDITVTATAHGINWECSNTTFFCTLAVGGKTGTDASYTGSATAKGFEDLEEPVKDPSEHKTTGPYKTGEQIGIWKS